jgi:small neutral amino acid transporter SnatA (MarC family)
VFARLLTDAKSAVSGLVLKYVARASVAVPFVIALGFALAAITVMLVERFGHVIAYWMVAGGLVVVGIAAAIVVSVKEHEEEVAEQQAEKADTEEGVSAATVQAIVQTPIALVSALFAAPGGATTALSVARLLGRNLPLVLLLVMIGALFWPSEGAGAPDEDLEVARKPNGSDDHMPSSLRH